MCRYHSLLAKHLQNIFVDILNEVSRSPNVSRTPDIWKSRSLNVSCEVLCQIGSVIASKPCSSSSSVIKAFAFHAAPSRFKSHPRTTFIILLFYELLKSYREGLTVISRASLVIEAFNHVQNLFHSVLRVSLRVV